MATEQVFHTIERPQPAASLLAELNPTPEDVVVLPGGTPAGSQYYAGSAVDLVKLLEAEGASVMWAEPREARQYVGYKSIDVILPTLSVGVAAIGIVVHVISLMVKKRDAPTNLTGTIATWHSDGRVEWAHISGEASAVLQALREWRGRTPDE